MYNLASHLKLIHNKRLKIKLYPKSLTGKMIEFHALGLRSQEVVEVVEHLLKIHGFHHDSKNLYYEHNDKDELDGISGEPKYGYTDHPVITLAHQSKTKQNRDLNQLYYELKARGVKEEKAKNNS